MSRPSQAGWFLWLAALASLVLQCPVNSAEIVAPSQAPTDAKASLGASDSVVVEAQWRKGPNGGHLPLMSVYLSNRTKDRIEFEKVMLNDIDLNSTNNTEAVWSQFYPGQSAAPGRTIVLQIDLLENPVLPNVIEIFAKGGQRFQAELRPHDFPEAIITGLTYSPDFQRIHVTYRMDDRDSERNRSLDQVLVNGNDLTLKSRIFEERQEDNLGLQGLLVIHLPAPLSQGVFVHVRLHFANESIAQTLSRSWTGIVLDGAGSGEKDAKFRKDLGLDLDPSARPLPGDPSLQDSRTQREGSSIGPILETRAKWHHEGDNRLCYPYLAFATMQNYNIYGQCADALGAGSGFYGCSEEEEMRARWAAEGASPKPAYWFPPRFVPGQRWLEGSELKLMACGIFGIGMKGIRYPVHTENAELQDKAKVALPLEAIQKLNAEIKILEPLLSPAIPVARETYDSKGEIVPEYDDHGRKPVDPMLRTYTLWSGDDGILVLVRILDYTIDAKAVDQGLKPRFHYKAKENIQIRIRRPKWLHTSAKPEVIDPLTKEHLPASLEGDRIRVTLPVLDLTRAVWIPNQKQNAPGQPAQDPQPGARGPGE